MVNNQNCILSHNEKLLVFYKELSQSYYQEIEQYSLGTRLNFYSCELYFLKIVVPINLTLGIKKYVEKGRFNTSTLKRFNVLASNNVNDEKTIFRKSFMQKTEMSIP